nr:MAG: hypothetical protein 1 [Aparavirus sp.]
MVNGVASVFGWSRPVAGVTAPVANIPGRGFCNFKATDTSVVLGMHSDNSIVEKAPIDPVSVDEMQISHICARPSLVNVITWKGADAVDTILGYNSVSPDLNEAQLVSGNVTVVDPTLGDYVFNKFGFWRADTHFRISIVKTGFHVGRLEVFYNPYILPAQTVDQIDTTNCYREIFDITNKNELEFVIPYQHSQILQHSVGISGSIGYLQFKVLAPLTAPDTVSNNVTIHVWKWYEKVAVAGASGHHLHIWDGTLPTKSVPATLQVNGDSSTAPPNVVFGEVNDEQSLIDACSAVCGEMCVNLREATRGFREATSLKDAHTVTTVVGIELDGYLGMCSNIFAFYRGGLSFKIIPNTASGSAHTFSTLSLNQVAGGDLPTHHTFNYTTPIHEVSVPFYTTYRRVPTNVSTAFPDLYAPTLTVEDYSGSSISARWFVAGKDDLTFSYLIGSPLLTLEKGS